MTVLVCRYGTRYLYMYSTQIRVVDPHHIDADLDANLDADPDSTNNPDADPDSDFLFDADPNRTFHRDADPDPDPSFKRKARTLEKIVK